jgi:hypothetical protein
MRNPIVCQRDWPQARLEPPAAGRPFTRAADWLSFAAAPTFAGMALVTGISGEGAMQAMCSAAGDGMPLTGMAAMYLLMSAFHLSPWLRLVSGGKREAGRP